MAADFENEGEDLIFLISQPRAGSTLIQRILENHPSIYTMPETWTMLHSLYALKDEGYDAEYNAAWSRLAVQDFLKSLPDGEAAYYKGVRKMHSYLYQLALEPSGKQYFLDKTPRYFHIIPELFKTFPKATFVILFRNPLAVLCSIITTWIKDNEHWSSIKQYQSDLLLAPSLLIEATQLIPDSSLLQIRYEDFIFRPEEFLNQLCEHLHTDSSPCLLNYNPSQQEGFGYSEQKKSVSQSGRPNAKNLNKWVGELEDPQTWRVVKDYLEMLGEDTVQKMGYSHEDLYNTVQAHKPTKGKLREAVPLQWLFEKPEGFRKLQYYLLRLNRSRQIMGVADIWTKARL